MKKILKSLMVAMVFAGAGLSLTACDTPNAGGDGDQQLVQENIKKISVSPDSVPSEIVSDNIEAGITSMKLKVYFNAGGFKEIPVTMDMISAEDLEALETTDGPVRITITYLGFQTKISIIMVLKLEINMDGVKLVFNDKDIKSCLLGGDEIPSPEDADMYVWGWKVDENGEDDKSVKGKFFPVVDNVCYVDEAVNKCLVVYMTKGASADWNNKIDQTADLPIRNGKVVFPNGEPVGIDEEFTIDLNYCKNHLENGTVSDDLVPLAYVTGGVASDYFTPIVDGKFIADSLTTNVVVYYMAAGTTETTARIEDAKANTKKLVLGFNTPEGQTDVTNILSVAKDVSVSLKGLGFKDGNDKPAAMPERGDAYIYSYYEGTDKNKTTNVFTRAIIDEGVIKASIPMDCNRAIIVFIKPGEKPNWPNKIVQTENLTVNADGTLNL